MARSNTKSAGGSLPESPQDATLQSKRRELFELRIRWKIANDAAKKSLEERKVIKARIDAITAELKPAPADENAEMQS